MAGIQNTQKDEVINYLIKEDANSSSLLCNLYDQIQRLLDDKAK